jgi:hypothetical protein
MPILLQHGDQCKKVILEKYEKTNLKRFITNEAEKLDKEHRGHECYRAEKN